jgi:hypothetical protein
MIIVVYFLRLLFCFSSCIDTKPVTFCHSRHSYLRIGLFLFLYVCISYSFWFFYYSVVLRSTHWNKSVAFFFFFMLLVCFSTNINRIKNTFSSVLRCSTIRREICKACFQLITWLTHFFIRRMSEKTRNYPTIFEIHAMTFFI